MGSHCNPSYATRLWEGAGRVKEHEAPPYSYLNRLSSELPQFSTKALKLCALVEKLNNENKESLKFSNTQNFSVPLNLDGQECLHCKMEHRMVNDIIQVLESMTSSLRRD